MIAYSVKMVPDDLRADRFPPDFLWGTGTSAYQIEGAADLDGRGESIWDRFSATPGKVRNGESGSIACDFYHRYREDIALMRELGATSFRLSISWPRILPEGRGRVNQPGLDFYDRVIDELLANDIQPLVTLYHWDLPVALEDAGGWVERSTVDAFCEYAEVVGRRLGDRVGLWLTQNEPWVIAWLGYGYGVHAPGRTSAADAIAAAHHVLLSHGLAADILRRESPHSRVGVTVDLEMAYPVTDDLEDVAACQEFDGERNRWFLDPLFGKGYPADVLATIRAERTAGQSRATCRRSQPRSTSSASTTTSGASSAELPTGAGGLPIRMDRSTRTWGGRYLRTASST